MKDSNGVDEASEMLRSLWGNLDDLRIRDPKKYEEILTESKREMSSSEPKPRLSLKLRHPHGRLYYLNVFSWCRISEPVKDSDPIPFCGGFLLDEEENGIPILNVATSPEVLTNVLVKGTREERNHFVELVLLFLEKRIGDFDGAKEIVWEFDRGKEFRGGLEEAKAGFLIGKKSERIVGKNDLLLRLPDPDVDIKAGRSRRLKPREELLIGKCILRNGSNILGARISVYVPDIHSEEDALLQIRGSEIQIATTKGQQATLRDLLPRPMKLVDKRLASAILSFTVLDAKYFARNKEEPLHRS